MARNYSLKSFLRTAPRDLLERYLHGRGVATQLTLQQMKRKDVDHLFAQVEAASEPVRRSIDRDFREIHALADESGSKALFDEASNRHHAAEITDRLANMGSHLERAFWTFLEADDIFRIASQLHHADTLRWRKWKDPIDCTPAVDTETTDALKDAVSDYYRYKEGRGRGCHVDHWERDHRLFWFVYPEDYAAGIPAFDTAHRFLVETLRPAFEVVFLYDRETKVLDTCVKGDKKTLRELQRVFGRIVLGVELGDEPSSPDTWALDQLLDRDFAFPTTVADGVSEVQIRSLRLDIIGGGSRRVTVESGAKAVSHAVHDLLDDLFPGQPIPRALLRVTSARLQIVFMRQEGGKRSLTFSMSLPDSTSLKQDPLDQKVRELLRRWGLDVSGQPQSGSARAGRSVQRTLSVR